MADDDTFVPCREAVDEFRAQRGITEPIGRADRHRVFWRQAASTDCISRTGGHCPVFYGQFAVVATRSEHLPAAVAGVSLSYTSDY